MLSNAYFLAKFRFDTAENEPAQNSQNFEKFANFADPNPLTPFTLTLDATLLESGRARRVVRCSCFCTNFGPCPTQVVKELPKSLGVHSTTGQGKDALKKMCIRKRFEKKQL